MGIGLGMVRYLLRYGKQTELFAKRESGLIGALKRNESGDKIIRAAEKVREAKLQQLKAQKSKKATNEQNKPLTANKPGAIEAKWQSMPVEDIIAIYKNKITENETTTG